MIAGVALTCLPLDDPNFPPELRAAATELASEGRGLLGMATDSAARRALFGPSLRPANIIFALLDGNIAGMASFKFRNTAPFAPSFADFVRTTGALGVWYWALFNYVEMRTSRSNFYIVGADAFPGFKRWGLGYAMVDELCRIAQDYRADAVEADVRPAQRRGLRHIGFKPAHYPCFSIGRLIAATNGPYTRVCLQAHELPAARSRCRRLAGNLVGKS